MTAVLDGNVSGRVLHKAADRRWRRGWWRSPRLAESAAEEVDGVALEAEADVCVDGSGDPDVGVAEEFLDDDEFDALFQQEGRGRVPQVVEADLPEAGLAEQGLEVAGEGGGFDRVAVGSGEDVAAVFSGSSRLDGGRASAANKGAEC